MDKLKGMSSVKSTKNKTKSIKNSNKFVKITNNMRKKSEKNKEKSRWWEKEWRNNKDKCIIINLKLYKLMIMLIKMLIAYCLVREIMKLRIRKCKQESMVKLKYIVTF